MKPGVGFLAISEGLVRTEAVRRAPLAHTLDIENTPECEASPWLREIRGHLANEARNRAATQALEQFFQLADATGRGDLLHGSLPVLDDFREKVRAARAEGLRVPLDVDDLDRQRATVLALIGQADLGAKLVTVDLKRRIGVPGPTPEGLRPVGPFPVTAAAIDVEQAVQGALERRSDLMALRTAYLGMTPDNLPTIRDLMRGGLGEGSSLAAVGVSSPRATAIAKGTLANAVRDRRLPAWPDAATVAELAVRRQQLYDLVLMRERQAADEVRAAAATFAAQTQQVALARWRLESLTAKAADAKKQGPLVEYPAQLEVFRARADVVAAVMNWHQARVKFLGAQGTFGAEGTNGG